MPAVSASSLNGVWNLLSTVTAAGGDDDGVAAVFLAGRRNDRVVIVMTAYRRDAGGLQNLHTEQFRLLPQALTEFEPRYRLRETGHVVQIAGEIRIATDGLAFNDEGFCRITRLKNGRGQARRAWRQ